MTKKQIILDYLSKDGNKEKQTKVQLIEISEIYGVTINRTQFLKVKSNATVESATANATVESATVESATVESATVSKIEWLDSLMEVIKNSTNVFQMAEAFRQCDCFVQKTGESIKEDIESLIEDLPLYQTKSKMLFSETTDAAIGEFFRAATAYLKSLPAFPRD